MHLHLYVDGHCDVSCVLWHAQGQVCRSLSLPCVFCALHCSLDSQYLWLPGGPGFSDTDRGSTMDLYANTGATVPCWYDDDGDTDVKFSDCDEQTVGFVVGLIFLSLGLCGVCACWLLMCGVLVTKSESCDWCVFVSLLDFCWSTTLSGRCFSIALSRTVRFVAALELVVQTV